VASVAQTIGQPREFGFVTGFKNALPHAPAPKKYRVFGLGQVEGDSTVFHTGARAASLRKSCAP
jgi:hypothetical protein